MSTIRHCLVWFIIISAVLTVLLTASAYIPNTVIEPKMLISSGFLSQYDGYDMMIKDVQSTRIDRYADSVLLGIAYQFDREDALRSVIEAKYYHSDTLPEMLNFLTAVKEKLPGNQQYLRYWHGSAGIVRLLMIFMTLPQIYIWHGIIFFFLIGMLIIRFIRRKMIPPAVGILTGLFGTAFWFVPISLEYTWVFLIMFVQLHIILASSFPRYWDKRYVFFLISGMVTNYLDFLTCETLTLLMPLLLLCWLDEKLPSIRTILIVFAAWGAGYAGMFLLKWGLAAIIMGENIMPYVTGHVEQRLVGTVGDVSLFEILLGSLQRNTLYLFPRDYGPIGMIIGYAALITAGYLGYVYHRKGFDRWRILSYGALGCVPYIRYIVLVNHSFLHGFFTYRAQFSTLFAIVLILSELTGWCNYRQLSLKRGVIK